MPCRPVRLLEVEQARSSLAYHFLSSVVCCALVCTLGTVECWGGRQGGCGLELCVCRLRVCGSQLAVCLVSLFVSVCRSCVSSSSVLRPPIPRWCPVRAWLFFTFLPTYLRNNPTQSTILKLGPQCLRGSSLALREVTLSPPSALMLRPRYRVC